MKLTVLVDNNTIIDKYYCGEPAVSYFIECEGQRFLFDAGYSDVFSKNAKAMGIDLLALDGIIISHGHNDHTWGLVELQRLYSDTAAKRPKLIAHPGAFQKKRENGLVVGSLLSPESLAVNFSVQLSKTPVMLTENLLFLGEIERQDSLEVIQPLGETFCGNHWQPDYVLDDSALVYKSARGLVIITACSHAGICNIIEYAKKVCGDNRIYDVIGGFHLLQPDAVRLRMTMDYFKKIQPHAIYAAHCTDLRSKINLAKVANVQEVGVGLEIAY
jgi:Metal-dependent hydrolases of the beta-lactamase superfamily II